jgi:hypothetical protein
MGTVTVLVTAVIATALALPAFVQALDWSGMPGDLVASAATLTMEFVVISNGIASKGWPSVLFAVLFAVAPLLGITSLVMASVASRKIKRSPDDFTGNGPWSPPT